MRAFVRPTESSFEKFVKFFRKEVKSGFYTTDPIGQFPVAVREFGYLPTWIRSMLCTVSEESTAATNFKNGMELSEQEILSLAGKVFAKPGAFKHPTLSLYFYMTCKGTWISNESGNIMVGGHRAAFIALLERIGFEPRMFNACFEDYGYPEGGTKAAVLNIKPWQAVKPEFQDRIKRVIENEALEGITLDKESEHRLSLAKGEARTKAVQALVLIKKLEKKDDVLKTLLNYRKQDKWRQDRQDKFLAPLIGSNWKETVGPVFGVGYFPVETPVAKKEVKPTPKKPAETKIQKPARSKGLDSLKDVFQKTGKNSDPKLGEEYNAISAVDFSQTFDIKNPSQEVANVEQYSRKESLGYTTLMNEVAKAVLTTVASPTALLKEVFSLAATPVEKLYVFLLAAPAKEVATVVNNEDGLRDSTQAAKLWLNFVADVNLENLNPTVVNLIEGETLRQRFFALDAFEADYLSSLQDSHKRLEAEVTARYTEEEAACKHLWLEVERLRLKCFVFLAGDDSDKSHMAQILEQMTELIKSRTRIKVDSVPGALIKAFKGSTDVVKTMDDLRALRDFTKGMTHLTGPIGDIIKQLQSSNDMVFNEAMYIATTPTA